MCRFHTGAGAHMCCWMPGIGPTVNMKMLTPMLVTTITARGQRLGLRVQRAAQHHREIRQHEHAQQDDDKRARPSGTLALQNTSSRAAAQLTDHMIRKPANRPSILARTYSEIDSGRLSTNCNECSLRSFMMPYSASITPVAMMVVSQVNPPTLKPVLPERGDQYRGDARQRAAGDQPAIDVQFLGDELAGDDVHEPRTSR